MNWHDPQHPIWALMRVVIRSVALLIMLLVTSSQMDREWFVLIAYALMDGGIEARGPWRRVARTEND